MLCQNLKDEPTLLTVANPETVHSLEYVGKRSYTMWAAIRVVRQNNKKGAKETCENKRLKAVINEPQMCAQVVVE